MTDDNQLDELFPDGFIGMRAGLREHITGGRFQGYDLGVYTYLHFFASWRCGIVYTNAVTIGGMMCIPVRSVNNSLAHLKELGYINYPKNTGKHGSYPIYIHKYRPTIGPLKGYELHAFATNNSVTVLYLNPQGHGVEAAWRKRGHGVDEALMRLGDGVLVACIEDNKEHQAGEAGVRLVEESTNVVRSEPTKPNPTRGHCSKDSCSFDGLACPLCGEASDSKPPVFKPASSKTVTEYLS